MSYQELQRESLRRRTCGRTCRGHITEFPIALSVFLFIVIFPLVDLVGLATGAATCYLSAHEAVSRAANQRRYPDSLAIMEQSASGFLKSGFAAFARLRPVSGYNNSGADLFIDATNYQTNQIQVFGPNSSVPPPVDTSTYIYECRVETTYQVGPTIDLACVPGLAGVPGLGKPAIIRLEASRQVEYPAGLATVAAPPPNSSVPQFNTVPTVAKTGPEAGILDSGWNHPNIYADIKNAGQRVVQEDVVLVPAQEPNWTLTGITVQSGQFLWIDLRADGTWGNAVGEQGRDAGLDANGSTLELTSAGGASALPGSGRFLLAGKLGGNKPFAVGKYLQNYALNQTGPLSLNGNDEPQFRSQDAGVQMVRVITTSSL